MNGQCGAKQRRIAKLLPVLGAILIGALLIAGLVAIRKAPERIDPTEAMTSVRFIEAQALPFVVQARGFGPVSPARHWLAVSSVEGKVSHRHPELESGAILAAGTLLLEIDPSRYRLAVAEAEAEAASLQAELAQLEQDARNTSELLGMERERLTLAETELARIKKLAASGTVTASRADEQLRSTLQQRQAVRSLENRLRLVPSQTQHLEAQLERIQTRRQQALSDLEDTRITAPFDLRVDEVRFEQDQHVNRGQTLLSADGIDEAEVVLQLPMKAARTLIAALPTPAAAEGRDLADYLGLAAIDARVRLVTDRRTEWAAQVTRISNRIDPVTRTVQVVLSVREPYRTAAPPGQPPLVAGMYVEGVLSVPGEVPRIVLPASALHQGEIYVADASDRLQRRPVVAGLMQRDLVVIETGLAPSERVIIDDLVPAIGGMPLRLRHDEDAELRLRQAATGDAR